MNRVGFRVALIALSLAPTTLTGCKRAPAPPENKTTTPAKTESHAGHEQDEPAGETSDLDLGVAALVGRDCEHGKKSYTCEACRYEVGFVRVPAEVIQGGLLRTTTIQRQTIAVPITLTGEIQFDERRVVHVGSQVEGIVKQVHIALGDQVRKGQPLMEIESVAIGEAQADYLQNQGLAQLARRNFQRVSELRQENIASEKEFLQARQEIEAAEIRVRGAQGKLTRLGSTIGHRGRLILRAPIDGRVLVMHAVPGEIAKTEAGMVTVGNNTTVWVWADLYERDIAAVTSAQAAGKIPASISVKAYPGREFPGTVDLISPAMDETSRTVKIRLEVENRDGRLLSGMFAAVKLFPPGETETLAAPRSAVLEDDGRSFVFIHYQGDYYVRRPVVPGEQWADWVGIKKGLAAGQTIAAEGAFLLKSDVLRSKMGAGCAD